MVLLTYFFLLYFIRAERIGDFDDDCVIFRLFNDINLFLFFFDQYCTCSRRRGGLKSHSGIVELNWGGREERHELGESERTAVCSSQEFSATDCSTVVQETGRRAVRRGRRVRTIRLALRP